MSTFLYRLGHLVARARLAVPGRLVLPGRRHVRLAGAHRRPSWSTTTRFPAPSRSAASTPCPSGSRRRPAPPVRSSSQSRPGSISDQQATSRQRSRRSRRSSTSAASTTRSPRGAVGTISTNKTVRASPQIQFDVGVTDLPEDTVPEVEKAAKPPPGAEVHRDARRRHVHQHRRRHRPHRHHRRRRRLRRADDHLPVAARRRDAAARPPFSAWVSPWPRSSTVASVHDHLLDHPVAGADDRPGRRHRLRPVHRHPAPTPAGARDGCRGVDRPGPGHGRDRRWSSPAPP